MSESPIFTRIQNMIDEHAVILFMKGTKESPMCGFSAKVCEILSNHGVDFISCNILIDPELREGIKQFTDWPTIPQLYIKGEFIGGCDIVREMDAAGELIPLFVAKQISYTTHR